MTKPWEEEWKMHTRERDVVVLKGSGKMVLSTGNPLYTGGPEDFARALLASKAPKMAMALLAEMVLWDDGQWHDEFRCPVLAGAQCADWCAAKREALREAGVLE